jgi:endoglucanase
VMAARLESAGVQRARGFFTNVANYYPTAQEQAYAEKVSALTGGSHYVIDTSRNGQGWRGTWCNGPGAGLGAAPRVVSDGTALDALLWVKTPGASDGTCNGGPAAGKWWSSFAQTLVANARLGSAPAATPAATPATTPSAAPTATATPKPTATPATTPKPTATASAAPTATATPKPTATATAKPATPPKPTATPKPTSAPAKQAPSVAPKAKRDSASSPAKRRITVRGWAFDRDDTSKPVTVRMTVDGKAVGSFAANVARPDVDRVHGVGRYHGYQVTVAAASGKRSVCLTAVGIGGGGNTSLGCTTVTVR